jgi:hypothetical protein
MSINFFAAQCQDNSNRKLFGLCDDRPEHRDETCPKERAYLKEDSGGKWIATVVNEERYEVTFTAVDHCIETKREDGTMNKRCDGFLSYDSSIIFVELKERGGLGNDWVIDGEKQLRASIGYFEAEDDSDNYSSKKAYIANKEHPKFKESQTRRMNQFLIDTGYVLRIENRIILQ